MYLRVKFSADGRMEGELDRRIGIAVSACGSTVEEGIWMQGVE